VVLSEQPTAFGLSSCGASCNAKCSVSTNDTTAAVAYSASTGKLGVLWGNSNSGELYRCTMPPP